MANVNKLAAYRYKRKDFEYVRLADVVAAQSSEKLPRYTVEISVGGGKASVKQSDKELTKVLPGNWILWECRLPFRLEFKNEIGPDGPGEQTKFDSKPAGNLHVRALKISEKAGDRLDYDIFVDDGQNRWLKADPSIIIDTVLQRIFVYRLKAGIPFPPATSTRMRTMAGAAKPAKKAANTKRSTKPAKSSPRAKSKVARKK